MEGLEISEVRFSKIDLGDRFDAEYFARAGIEIEERLKAENAAELRGFGDFVASAFYPAATHLYEAGDVPFIRCVDCVNYPLITTYQDNSFEKIPLDFAVESKGINFLNKGEIVITKVGTPSYASMIFEHDQVALSRTVLGIKNIQGIDPHYLLMFLRSRYGFSQLQRNRELTIQYQLTLERVKKTLVFVPSDKFQKSIASFCIRFEDALTVARQHYAKAETLLLATLGMTDFLPSAEAINIKSFKDSFSATGRLDAEYYQPKYEQIVKHISAQSHERLVELVNIKKSIEPGSDAYTEDEEGLPFLRVADYSKYGMTKPQKCLSTAFVAENHDELEKLKPKKDTILFSKDGSVGEAFCLHEDADFITSGAILHLTVKNSDELLPDYLTLVLNSKLVKMQAERDAGGSIILHWRLSEIENVLVPLVDMPTQKKIAAMVQESFSLKAESERLLNVAKHAVEIAIEQNENAGMAYIKDNS